MGAQVLTWRDCDQKRDLEKSGLPSCSLERPPQQRQQATSGHRAQHINDRYQERDGGLNTQAEEGDGNDLKVLRREDKCYDRKQHDDYQMKPSHGTNSSPGGAFRSSSDNHQYHTVDSGL
jgi:hypothetical protein